MKHRFEQQDQNSKQDIQNEKEEKKQDPQIEPEHKINSSLEFSNYPNDKPLLKQFMSRLNAIAETATTTKIKKHTSLFL
jgi:hypothetical protein